MIAGTILGCICGLIKKVSKSILLCFAVLFTYILAFSVDMKEANSMFFSGIPFLEQLKWGNSILQNIGSAVDFADIYILFIKQFGFWKIFDELCKLYFFTFEVGVIHALLFNKKYKVIYDWLL